MSLATRCLACGTIFRVVQDQLKVSEGWVRCGRCDEVFNALDGLFDLDREAPPRWTAPLSPSPADTADGIVIDSRAPVTASAPQAYAPIPPEPAAYDRDWESATTIGDADRHGEARGDSRGDTHDVTPAEPFDPALQRHDPYFDTSAIEGRHSDLDAATTAPIDIEHGRADFADADADAEFRAGLLPEDGGTPKTVDEASSDLSSMPMHFTPMPAFVASADRDARSRRPGRMIGVAALVLLLVTMLGVQAAHHFRDTIASRWPATHEPLERWCAIADCRLGAPRRIEDIVVENTGLARAVPGTDTYRLVVTLRNRGVQSLAVPSIDLTLTDNAGQLVARRTLAPADFEITAGKIAGSSASNNAAELAPNADLPLRVLIATGSSKVSGYTVEVFYP